MVGIVTVDDAMIVLQDEATEDMSVMAGVVPNEESYFGTSVWKHARNRFPWLLFLMLSATITGLILGHFEAALAVMPILNTFIPMLTGTGGNCGSQSSTLIIRGLCLSMVNGVRVIIMYGDPLLAFAIGLTMIATILLSKTVGCVLPLVAKKCRLDPAIMAAPLITTLVDTGTILVYFAIVTRIFHI